MELGGREGGQIAIKRGDHPMNYFNSCYLVLNTCKS